jgi:aspartyl/asparaginyl beta-hydroxylase (cupin superfamily)
MNTGAALLQKNFLDVSSLEKTFRQMRESEWKPTWADGPYADQMWRVVKLIEKSEQTDHFARFPELKEIVDRFRCPIRHMMFYSLLPGGVLHPHRDMSGAVGLGGLRFHIPIITNNGVDFRVSGERVVMLPGDLWALDTSYLHAVANRGAEDRVHLVIEVEVNDWVRNQIPPLDHRYYLHQANLVLVAAQKAARVMIFQPKLIGANLQVARNVAKRLGEKVRRRVGI